MSTHGRKGRLEMLRRVLLLMRRLEGQRHAPPIKMLAEDYRVHRRTIRRDLELLETVGIQLPPWREEHTA